MLLAIVSFFFWPALIVALFMCWGDADADIKVPFAMFAALTAWGVYRSHQVKAAQEALFALSPFLA